MKIYITFIVILFTIHFSNAQIIEREVVATDGQEYAIGTMTLSWTLGELVTETFCKTEAALSQGFQQPDGWDTCVSPDAVEPRISRIDGGFGGTLTKNGLFAGALDNIGDINGDGFIDFAVGVPGASPVNAVTGKKQSKAGALYITFHNFEGRVIGQQKISADEGGIPPDSLKKKYAYGSAVAGWHGKVVVGLPGYESPGKLKEAGAIDILDVNESGMATGLTRISRNMNGGPSEIKKKFKFGVSVANIGDVNKDGVDDLAVGAPGDDNTPGSKYSKAGAVYVLLMNASGMVNSYNRISAENGVVDIAKNALFGASVAGIGDFNKDGTVDMAVGAQNYTALDENNKKVKGTGAVHLIYLDNTGAPTGTALISYDSTKLPLSKKMNFGMATAGAGDLNNDCVTDLLVGSPGGDLAIKDGGSAWVVTLNIDGSINSATEHSQAAHKKAAYGAAVGSYVDRCYTLLAVGAPQETIERSKKEGAFYLTFDDFTNTSAKLAPFENVAENQSEDDYGQLETMATGDDDFSAIVYPNPTQGRVMIEAQFLGDKDLSIELYDMMGNRLNRRRANATNGWKQQIDLSRFLPGSYVLRLSSNRRVYSRKIMLVR